MDEAKLLGRGISFPPRLGPDGRLAFSAGSRNIREMIRVILLTEQLERVARPEFGGGLRRYLYEPNVPSTHRVMQERILSALKRWEPRIKVRQVSVNPDPDRPQGAVITIDYTLVATGQGGTEQVSVELGG